MGKLRWITASCTAVGLLGVAPGCGPGSDATKNTPTLTAFTPAHETVYNNVAITGTNLAGATAVAFGGVPAYGFTVNSASSITASPALAARSGAITVTTPDGTATSGSAFLVTPGLSAVPAQVTRGGVVTLSGSGLDGTSLVLFGASPVGATSALFTVNGPNSVTVTVPLATPVGTAYVFLTSNGLNCQSSVIAVN
jgi:hypothetical protein